MPFKRVFEKLNRLFFAEIHDRRVAHSTSTWVDVSISGTLEKSFLPVSTAARAINCGSPNHCVDDDVGAMGSAFGKSTMIFSIGSVPHPSFMWHGFCWRRPPMLVLSRRSFNRKSFSLMRHHDQRVLQVTRSDRVKVGHYRAGRIFKVACGSEMVAIGS